MRRLVAFVLHAPGLWLVYRERLSPALLRQNLLAGGLTIVAVGCAAVFGPDGLRWEAALAAFAVGHLSWSTWLAARLPETS